MNKRRRFLAQSSLAAMGLMFAKPFNAMAKYSSSVLVPSFNYNSISFLHTSCADEIALSQVKKVAANSAVVLLHAGNHLTETQPLNFDATINSLKANLEGDYNIIYKNGIKIGVIAAKEATSGLAGHVNTLSAYLKKQKDCQLVICFSQLGYKQKDKLDDSTLAAESEHIDIILGSKAGASPSRPMIAQNKNKAEVILQYTEASDAVLSKINIGFSPAGNKQRILF